MSESRGCLGMLAKVLGLGGGKKEVPPPLPLPVGLTDAFLSAAELSFHHVLRSLLSPALAICPKVRLADVLYARRPHENQGISNKLRQKHVDFLVCDGQTMTPRFVIELDDASHQRKDREERDAFVDEAMRAAGLPIIHVKVARAYVLADVQRAIERGMGA